MGENVADKEGVFPSSLPADQVNDNDAASRNQEMWLQVSLTGETAGEISTTVSKWLRDFQLMPAAICNEPVEARTLHTYEK